MTSDGPKHVKQVSEAFQNGFIRSSLSTPPLKGLFSLCQPCGCVLPCTCSQKGQVHQGRCCSSDLCQTNEDGQDTEHVGCGHSHVQGRLPVSLKKERHPVLSQP